MVSRHRSGNLYKRVSDINVIMVNVRGFRNELSGKSSLLMYFL